MNNWELWKRPEFERVSKYYMGKSESPLGCKETKKMNKMKIQNLFLDLEITIKLDANYDLQI